MRTYSTQELIQSDVGLTVDDVSLVPRYGIVGSRKDIILDPFIFMNAPMDCFNNLTFLSSLRKANQTVVFPRRMFDSNPKALLDFIEESSSNLDSYVIAIGKETFESMKYWIQNGLFKRKFNKPKVLLDIAHGCSIVGDSMIDALNQIQDNVCEEIEFISGSIASPDQISSLVYATRYESYNYRNHMPYSYIRVGIGNGSACTTRLATGIGIPQFSAVASIANRLQGVKSLYKEQQVKIIADGGIRMPADAIKYLVAGADHIMTGRTFASASELQGVNYRGQASAAYQKDNDLPGKYVEGINVGYIEPQQTTEQIVNEYEAGLKSALSYLGVDDLLEARDNARWVRVTSSFSSESKPRPE